MNFEEKARCLLDYIQPKDHTKLIETIARMLADEYNRGYDDGDRNGWWRIRDNHAKETD